MNTEEKFYSAKMALKMIAAVKPKTKWVETGYNDGHDEDCSQCTKMIQIAKFALQELGEENENKA